ncbi:MAG: alanine/ornithine racemase family PLP-dependent enzyme [Flavobacteriales bacterium]|nr:alanine/ornithine racemase family PLP-dependent enzyme [Flavobacteriales bacterium]
MAYIELYKDKLKHNYNKIDALLKKHHKEWALVTKLLCGNERYIQEIINLGAKEICDSRVSNLKVIKKLNPKIQTVYIKPPAKRSIKNIVQYADVSFNTELETIKLLSAEAIKQKKLHKIIIMIEMGDLREGVMGEDLLDFYEEIFRLKGIEVTGIGTNLNCMSGVLPSHDKLIQLSLYEQLIETKFNRKIPWVTGGTSITLPMLQMQQIPKGINHFRIGETLFFGVDILNNKPFKGLKQDVIKLFAEIIEITEKPKIPTGELAENPSGVEFEIKEEDIGETSYRAIIDIGLLDISPDFLMPVDTKITVIGASSDMIILDFGKSTKKYKVGDLIPFNLKYMGALGLFNSDYIEKRLV